MAKPKEHHHSPHHAEQHHDPARHEPAQHHHQLPLASRRRFNIQSLAILVVILAGIGLYLVFRSHAATPDTLSVTPTNSTVGLGTSFNVTIDENSGTDAVNAVEADLTYDQTKLQFNSIDASSSAFSLAAASSGGNGKITIARAAANGSSPKTLTGDQVVAVVNFTAIASGAANVNFAATSALIRASDTTDLNPVTTGGTYTVADTTPPDAPTSLTSPSKTATTISLAWSVPSDNVGVTGYQIFRNGTKIGTSTVPSFTDTGLTPSTSYSYQIVATDAAGNASAKSTASAFSTLADTSPPGVPTGVNAPSKTDITVSLAWTAPSDNVKVTGYQIFRNGAQIGTSATASFTDTGLAPNTSYSYQVLATDAAGNLSAKSTAIAVTTAADTTKPDAPTGLNSPTKTSTAVNLSWTASKDDVGVTGYRIYRNGTQVGTSTTTLFSDTGLTPSTSYSYNVAAVDAAGNVSAQSPTLAVTTAAPPVVAGDVNGDGHVNITDLSIVASHWGLSGQTRSTGDVNGDGTVDIFDLSIVAGHWGT